MGAGRIRRRTRRLARRESLALKGEDTGWAKQPKVTLLVRHPGEKFVARQENEWPGGTVKGLGNLNAVFTGVGPFRHNDPRDRPAAVFDGDVTLHMGPDRQACVLLPVIPPK